MNNNKDTAAALVREIRAGLMQDPHDATAITDAEATAKLQSILEERDAAKARAEKAEADVIEVRRRYNTHALHAKLASCEQAFTDLKKQNSALALTADSASKGGAK